ncbi:MAG: methylmalonyl Co-A mutase-associated GTPase MeaB [Planctomycetes bacterium]|nr:methylmalonyl Co-A mutase-associated GTPase MeaB [Planctomycetota bacterium]
MNDGLAARIAAGDRLALAKGLTLVERGVPEGVALACELFPRTGHAYRVGITGPPGVGKSTLAGALVRLLRKRNERIGVIAVDPSSAFTGGALLGDRVRMQEFAPDADVFIRSMATRGVLGGLARATMDSADLMDAYGADWILLETAGVGQSEIDVAEAADTTVVVVSPESGDGIQALKAGLAEIADVFVVNKADREGAERTERDLLAAQEFHADPARRSPPVFRTSAERNEGIEALLEGIVAHRSRMEGGTALRERRRSSLAAHVKRIVVDRVREMFGTNPALARRFEECLSRVESRGVGPYEAANELLELLFETNAPSRGEGNGPLSLPTAGTAPARQGPPRSARGKLGQRPPPPAEGGARSR